MSDLQGAALATAIACVVANFGWQALSDRNWLKALERSWFQVAAVALVLVTAHGRGL